MIKIALYWVYGVVIPFMPWDGGKNTAIQALACESEQRRGDVYQALHCVALGPPMTPTDGGCNALLATAKIEMPELPIRTCVSLRRADLERLKIPK